MPRKPAPKRRPYQRRDPYERALETAKSRIGKATDEKKRCEEKLALLDREIPRLQAIINVLDYADANPQDIITYGGLDAKPLPATVRIPKINGVPVPPRIRDLMGPVNIAPAIVPEPDSEDALLVDPTEGRGKDLLP